MTRRNADEKQTASPVRDSDDDRGTRGRLATIGSVIGSLLAATFLASSAAAQAVHFDVSVQENALDGRLEIHGHDFDVVPAQSMVEDKRVYVRGVSLSGSSVFSEDPGFYSNTDPVGLAPLGLLAPVGNEQMLFNVLAAPTSTMPELGGRTLSWWDGTGPVVWGSKVDADEGIDVIEGFLAFPNDSLVVDGGSSDLVGYVIDTSSPTGFFHKHLKFLLLPDNGNLPPSGPEDGVYLLLMELSYPAYSEWVPVFIGVEAFAGGGVTQTAAAADIESDLLLPLCSDGIDNDKDGLVDFPEDEGCADADDMSERGATTECDDGIDNDGDGNVDFHDLDGDGASDHNGESSCLHPTNLYELVTTPEPGPEPGFSVGLGLGLVVLSAVARRGRARRGA